jgi:hypothetical protein
LTGVDALWRDVVVAADVSLERAEIEVPAGFGL